MATTTTSLYQLILNLLNGDQDALDAFRADPDSYFASCGDFSVDDVKDALTLAREDDDSGPSSHRSSNDSNDNDDSSDDDDDDDDDDSDDDTSDAISYLRTYITNNFIDDRDTTVDNSINQQIDTDGGDVDQDFDIHSTVASGDGSLAVGGDVEDSTLTSGDGNVIGDGNVTGDGNAIGDGSTVLSGDDNTAAFGDGDAGDTEFGDVELDNGSALSTGDGFTSGAAAATGSFNDTDVETTTSTENTDSFNTDVDVDTDTDTTTTTTNDVDSHDDIENHLLSDNEINANVGL